MKEQDLLDIIKCKEKATGLSFELLYNEYDNRYVLSVSSNHANFILCVGNLIKCFDCLVSFVDGYMFAKEDNDRWKNL